MRSRQSLPGCNRHRARDTGGQDQGRSQLIYMAIDYWNGICSRTARARHFGRHFGISDEFLESLFGLQTPPRSTFRGNKDNPLVIQQIIALAQECVEFRLRQVEIFVRIARSDSCSLAPPSGHFAQPACWLNCQITIQSVTSSDLWPKNGPLMY